MQMRPASFPLFFTTRYPLTATRWRSYPLPASGVGQDEAPVRRAVFGGRVAGADPGEFPEDLGFGVGPVLEGLDHRLGVGIAARCAQGEVLVELLVDPLETGGRAALALLLGEAGGPLLRGLGELRVDRQGRELGDRPFLV